MTRKNEAETEADTLQEVEKLAERIKCLLGQNTENTEMLQSGMSSEHEVDQVVLNLTVRSYYSLLRQLDLKDTHFNYVQQLEPERALDRDFLLVQAILRTDNGEQLHPKQCASLCLAAMSAAMTYNNRGNQLVVIVRTLNLLVKKFPTNCEEVLEVPLQDIYDCLQRSGQHGLREEVLLLYTNCCQLRERAVEHFQYIKTFWPWTNRNKLYLISCILSKHSLDVLLPIAESKDFFAGLRMSLSYKRLLAASQHLVKALSGQESQELLELFVEVLTHGNRQELSNLQSQWFGRLPTSQQDKLFELLQQRPEITNFPDTAIPYTAAVTSVKHDHDGTANHRLVLIFKMFARQVYATSKLHFFKISTQLITNCFQQLEVDAQLLVYYFVVENLGNFAIEDGLDFVLAFVRHHKGINNAQQRHGILGRLPVVINHIARNFRRLGAADSESGMCSSTLEKSITEFFRHLQGIVEADMANVEYQPKIFALKLCELLFWSLYAPQVAKIAKNSSVALNQDLGAFLLHRPEPVFDAARLSKQLLNLLDDPLGYDDALDVVVVLLAALPLTSDDIATESLKRCLACCSRSCVDECGLCARYAKVAVRCAKLPELQPAVDSLYVQCYETLRSTLASFEEDPLMLCKSGRHLFGYLCVLNEVALCGATDLYENESKLHELLLLVQEISNVVLKLLNAKGSSTAASFQDMEESLQLLVEQSSYSVHGEEHAVCRKFMLMSFWLTLKACCDLTASIGSYLAAVKPSSFEHLAALDQCLQLHVAVLTRCRHKGAIEAAGVSIGRLARSITSRFEPNTQAYELLHKCLTALFVSTTTQQVSTTRRGAGFSIMLLHVLKNEMIQRHRQRPLLQRVLGYIWQQLLPEEHFVLPVAFAPVNCDRLDALMLHYLCVLVKDTELRDSMSPHFDKIMLAAMRQIDCEEWTVCNAALQLFGALVPKVVGQRQAHDCEEEGAVDWEPTEVTYSEVMQELPQACAHILQYCRRAEGSTRSVILFLGFLAQVEHLGKGEADCDVLLLQFRELMWTLLGHQCAQVRRLAATCFVRAHELRIDLPQALLGISQIIFDVGNENFCEGLLHVLQQGVVRLQHEGQHTLTPDCLKSLKQQLQTNLENSFKLQAAHNLRLLTLCKLTEVLLSVGFTVESEVVRRLVSVEKDKSISGDIGRDLWLQLLAQISN